MKPDSTGDPAGRKAAGRLSARLRRHLGSVRADEMYRDLYDNAPDMFCSVDAESGLIIQCNQALLDKTGYARSEAIGMHILDLYHPDCIEDVKRARASFRKTGYEEDLEFKLRRKDGSALEVNLNVSAVRDAAGRVLISRSVWRDVTRRKQAERRLLASHTALQASRSELQKLAGKLLSEQEAERRRLARALHDDLTQRLAMLSIEAELVERQVESGATTALESLRQMKGRIVQLSMDAHTISHRLHPSILTDLGLATAIESECAGLARKADVRIRFEPKNVPPAVPSDISLCLYRVAQESLRNVVRHAGARLACVVLEGTERSILLSVSDNGAGFEPRARHGSGLGLAALEERVRLVRGELSICSLPGRGTTVEVRVPLG